MLQRKHLYAIKSSLKFAYSRKKLQHLHLIQQISQYLLLCLYLHLILLIASERLLARLDTEIAINLALSINPNM